MKCQPLPYHPSVVHVDCTVIHTMYMYVCLHVPGAEEGNISWGMGGDGGGGGAVQDLDWRKMRKAIHTHGSVVHYCHIGGLQSLRCPHFLALFSTFRAHVPTCNYNVSMNI